MKNSLLKLILRRIALGILTLLAISLLITVGVEALSGDVCTAMMGQMASEDKVAACHRTLNLDRPTHIRYIEWLVNFVQGDMGKALTNHREVADVIGNRVGNTFFSGDRISPDRHTPLPGTGCCSRALPKLIF